jgi:Ca-activated chloride channel family protein
MRSKLLRGVLVAAMFVAVLATASAWPLLARGEDWFGVSWQHPWALLLLLVVPLVLWRGTFGEDARMPRLRVGTVAPLALGPKGARAWLRDVPGVLRAAAIAFIALSLARPISFVRPDSSDEKGIDIILVLDLSGSMKAIMDAAPGSLPSRPAGIQRPTRLDVAKEVIRDFIGRRKTDRIGVVVFGKAAYVLSPPTLDYHLLDGMVSRMSLELIDNTATAIGDAVGVAVARLRRSEARSKAVVLLTDGDSNAGSISPDYAGHLAKVVGCRVYTIQIGNGDDAEVQDGFDYFGNPRYVRVRYPVNPELLKKLSGETGGEAYVATDAKGLSESMHDVLNHLEKTRFAASLASFEDLFPFMLFPSVLLLALDALVRAWALRRFP